MSSVLYKLFKLIFKNRFDWWFKSSSILLNKLFVLRCCRYAIHYLTNFIDQLYQSFNNREYFITTYIAIWDVSDSIDIPLSLSHLEFLNLLLSFISLFLNNNTALRGKKNFCVPASFINLTSSIFSNWKSFFSASLTYTTFLWTFVKVPELTLRDLC